MVRPLRRLALMACLLALAAGAAACGEEEPGFDEPAREGLALSLDGIDYNVFITRQLNPEVTPDEAYYTGPEPPPDELLYGVFMQVCNNSDEPLETADSFIIKDNQGNEFEPEEVELENNNFLYEPVGARPRPVHPGGRQRGPARPYRGHDAAVPAAAPDHREPAARAGDRR